MDSFHKLAKSIVVQTRNIYQSRPGILGTEFYIPNKYVAQEDLEVFDGVGEGKYTIGLGQSKMAFVDDLEDTGSMMMTCVESLLEKYDISQDDIGAIFVGTETQLDKSKSLKSYIMNIFDTSFDSNTNIEGVDNINACYGGSQSFFDACNWVESHLHEEKERFVIVVSGDIAEYDDPAARPTGGAGVVALLVGRDATIQLNNEKMYSHFENAYDFYKPDPHRPYPIVHGHLSNACYLHSIDRCYTKGNFKERDYDYLLFHAPYNKLIQKSVGFMKYLDYLNEGLIDNRNLSFIEDENVRKEVMDVSLNNANRWEISENLSIQNCFRKEFSGVYDKKTKPATYLNRDIGNTYTSALYFSLLGLIEEKGEDLQGNDVLMFSYGSGLASTLYELRIREEREERFSLSSMKEKMDVERRIYNRKRYSAEEYNEIFLLREKMYSELKGYKTKGNVAELEEGTYYLEECDEYFRRSYGQRTPISQNFHQRTGNTKYEMSSIN